MPNVVAYSLVNYMLLLNSKRYVNECKPRDGSTVVDDSETLSNTQDNLMTNNSLTISIGQCEQPSHTSVTSRIGTTYTCICGDDSQH